MSPTVIQEIHSFISNMQTTELVVLLRMMSTVIVSYVTTRFFEHVNLDMSYFPKSIKCVQLPKVLQEKKDSTNIDRFQETEFRELIEEFVSVLEENFKKEDLQNFYRNMDTVRIKTRNMALQNFGEYLKIAGTYNSSKNSINLNNGQVKNTLLHELFHMASAKKYGKSTFSGFKQFSSDFAIGSGLTEGYTQLLTERYFSKKHPAVKGSYQDLVLITKSIEKIIGKEKMESLYLNCNLNGLIEELKKYMTEEEVMKIITITDVILTKERIKNLTKAEKNKFDQNIGDVWRIIYRATLKKGKMLFDKGEITDVDYELDYRRIVIPISGYLSTNGSGYATPSEKVSELSEMLNEERKAYPQVVDDDRLREEEINRLKS